MVAAEEYRFKSQRVVVVDTETTGFDPFSGDRIVEVACVELVNLMPTGRELHFYCNPERDMPDGAFAIHGLSAEFLSDQPVFAIQAARFVEFLEGAVAMIAHNADFDVRFLNWELRQCGLKPISCQIDDTLAIARRKFPGSPASLDALCRRFEIDLTDRTKHGALIDTKLLAKVYLELMGGQQPGLALIDEAQPVAFSPIPTGPATRPYRSFPPTDTELGLHQAMLVGLKDAIWSLS